MRSEGCGKAQAMKHPDLSIEASEFNLGRAPDLRCTSSSSELPFCGHCDSCHLGHYLSSVQTWFSRAGHQSRRRFLLGLVRRLQSVDLLNHVIDLLKPVLHKDFVYARTRVAPGLDGDRATNSGDRALNEVGLETSLAKVWIWFEAASYWTKSNFLMGVMRKCEPHELHIVGAHAKTLLAPQQRSFAPTADYEAESITSSRHSFHSDEHPDLDMVSIRPGYSQITIDPFPPPSSASTRPKSQEEDQEVESDDDDASLCWGTDEGSLDPTCFVIPVSTKAYAGVARYVDFIARLPVHLSKYVLSFLETTTLSNCLCVSQHWRELTEGVLREDAVNQRLKEEIMLMQGTAAHTCNPIYAKDIDVAVPNIRLHSWETIRTNEEVRSLNHKSEASMTNAYAGCSTRNIIMEERNVYCGPYNVLILSDNHDPGRVIHTDGSPLVTMGSTDRKVRFLNCETAREDEKAIAGHSGSIKCVALDSKRKFVLSGSYDTSIRKWSMETGKCLKIFHGHRDTINCIQLHGDMAASGSKDHTCKVWNIDSMECIHMFKHKDAVTAVCFSDDVCITGCAAGKVKVWDMASGKLIKRLTGHQSGVTGIRFDRWHIITAGRDGYALAWSSQGDHARCLNAFRHPKEVLCVEFMFLRVVTGAADGKIRIWNMVTGQCLRIMRGNSRSDPITNLVAIDNRITINTVKNVIVFNFEPITYDYTLEDDKMPPLVQYMSYSDTPVRPQPYPYIRAQRMAKAGATNTKIVRHDEKKVRIRSQFGEGSEQIPHSAKTLSSKSMQMAKRIQSAGGRLEGDRTPTRGMMQRAAKSALNARNTQSAGVQAAESKHDRRLRARGSRESSRSQSPHSAASSVSFKRHESQEDQLYDARRRVSWAFDEPNIPPCKDVGLMETKSLLRSQMRIPEEEKIPPDFVYLKVNAIQNKLKQTAEVVRATEAKRKEEELYRWRSGRRPSSSPGRVDSRTKVMLRDMSADELRMLHLIPEQVEPDAKSEENSAFIVSKNSGRGTRTMPPSSALHTPQPMAIITEYGTEKIDAKPNVSLHSNQVKSHIPNPKLLRPHTASVVHNRIPEPSVKVQQRPLTALSSMHVETAPMSVKRPVKEKSYSSSAMETSHVPMLMYPPDMQERLSKIKQRKLKEEPPLADWTSGPGKISLHNHPLRSHVDFKLRTFQQEEEELRETEAAHQAAMQERDRRLGDSQRKMWLSKVKGREHKNQKVKCK